MIDVRSMEIEGGYSPAVRITLRNGNTYIMMVTAMPASKFVGYAGFEKFMREQTIRSGSLSTVRLTMVMEKEQTMLIPALVAHVR